jgi:hypothetical protein
LPIDRRNPLRLSSLPSSRRLFANSTSTFFKNQKSRLWKVLASGLQPRTDIRRLLLGTQYLLSSSVQSC